MNKEALRKELEDCWKAGCNAMLYDLGHTATNHPNRDTYIKSRLAALDDVDDVDDVDWKAKYEKCIDIIRRFDAGIIGMYDL